MDTISVIKTGLDQVIAHIAKIWERAINGSRQAGVSMG
jgi:hypothetical protein